jgi:hypothetical protein
LYPKLSSSEGIQWLRRPKFLILESSRGGSSNRLIIIKMVYISRKRRRRRNATFEIQMVKC